MNEVEVYNQLPDDDGLAFVMLEQFYKKQNFTSNNMTKPQVSQIMEATSLFIR